MIILQLRKLAFKIVHSTTKLLPAWKELLGELGQPVVLIPRDVRTRWNSTFEMLDSCLKHKKALTQLCSDKSNGLRSFEVSEREWEIAKQLRNMLKVRRHVASEPCFLKRAATDAHPLALVGTLTVLALLGLQGCDIFLLKTNSQPGLCDPRHGPYRRSSDDGFSRRAGLRFCPARICRFGTANIEQILFSH